MMPRDKVDTVTTCHGYGTNIDFTHKNEIADTKLHNILHTLKYLGITGYSSNYNGTLITCNQDNQSLHLL